MEIIQIVGLGLIATIIVVILRQERPEIALQVSIVTGVIIFLFVINKLAYIIQILNDLADRVNIDFIYFSTVLKIIGIAYIAEFGAQVSRDAGESSIATKIEMAGKILIMVISVPILTALLDLVIKIMP